MAIGQMTFFSKALQRDVSFHFIFPNDAQNYVTDHNPEYERPMKTLYLLHGYNSAADNWILNSSIMDIALRYNLCVIFPNGENSFYLNAEATGRQYATYTGEELVAYTRETFGLSEKREDTLIGGFSMGGFGAIHTGLMFPGTFGSLFALSSALILHEYAHMQPEDDNPVANFAYYQMIFGEQDTVVQSENNPEELVRRIKKNGGHLPGIYMACGTEDFLLEKNRNFRDFLEKEEVPLTYCESSGSHDYRFWNQYLQKAVTWMLQGKK